MLHSRVVIRRVMSLKTTDRVKYMNFTEPFFSLPTVIVTKRDAFYAGTMDALNNKRLGVVEGYVFVELITNDFPDINLLAYRLCQ